MIISFMSQLHSIQDEKLISRIWGGGRGFGDLCSLYFLGILIFPAVTGSALQGQRTQFQLNTFPLFGTTGSATETKYTVLSAPEALIIVLKSIV
jgi:hypothetical protein